jgi:hypothetical protein
MLNLILVSFIIPSAPQAGDSCPPPRPFWNDRVSLWSIPHHPNGPNPFQAAASATHLFVVAENSKVPARLAGARGGQILGLKIPLGGTGKAEVLSPPPGHPLVRFPRIAVDDSGTLHMVWIRYVSHPLPRSEDVADTTFIWTARYRGNRWERPQRLTWFLGGHWTSGSASDLVRSANGDLHIIVPTRAFDPGRYIIALSRHRGQWSVQKVPTTATVLYSSLTTRNDSLFAGLVMPVFGPGTDVNSVWFAMSPDGGRRWEAPVLVSRSYDLAARELRVVAQRSGTIRLLWVRAGEPTDFFSRVLWTMSSRDLGRTWREPANVSPSSRLTILGADEGAEGMIDLVLWSNDSIAAMRVCGAAFSTLVPVDGALGATGIAAVVAPGRNGAQVIWSAVIPGPGGEPRRVWYVSTLH